MRDLNAENIKLKKQLKVMNKQNEEELKKVKDVNEEMKRECCELFDEYDLKLREYE